MEVTDCVGLYVAGLDAQQRAVESSTVADCIGLLREGGRLQRLITDWVVQLSTLGAWRQCV